MNQTEKKEREFLKLWEKAFRLEQKITRYGWRFDDEVLEKLKRECRAVDNRLEDLMVEIPTWRNLVLTRTS
jgi:hypothetical protein